MHVQNYFAPINVFPQRKGYGRGKAGIHWELDSKKNPKTLEFDTELRYGSGKLDTISSKLNYITILMANPEEFGHQIFLSWEIRYMFL